MTTAMGPPPPKTPATTATAPSTDPDTHHVSSASLSVKPSTGPQPPKSSTSPDSEPSHSQTTPQTDSVQTYILENPNEATTPEPSAKPPQDQPQHVSVPYTIPPWSEPPCQPFYLEVLKDGSIIDQFSVCEKGAYMFGRVDLCDFILEHPTVSRFHAVLQFKSSGEAYLYDIGSTHGTFVNKSQVKKKVYVELHVGDVIRFGHSSRLYIFQGPTDLMPPESDLKKLRSAKVRQEMEDREASIIRAKQEASLADGISWGMVEDAIEEAEDDVDEVTWQTHKGQLTEKQEKTREKVIKRYEKIANMKKEIDAIRAKDIAQGGLTQGQQTQIARNEQRISQIMEELENLEETLNESIQESVGARTGRKSRGKKKGEGEDEDDDFLSEDDEFYDRTKRKHSNKKSGEKQSVETAETLLDKKDAIIKEMDDKKQLLSVEKNRAGSETEGRSEAGDALDAYMSGLSSQLVLDETVQLQEELSVLQTELERIVYLLKFADPTGEAAMKRDKKAHEPKSRKCDAHISASQKQPPILHKKKSVTDITLNYSAPRLVTSDANVETPKNPEADNIVRGATESKSAVYTVVKPQWLGAIDEKETSEIQQREAPLDMQESDEFVGYKDRKTVLGDADKPRVLEDSAIENAAIGLIIRKRKQVEEPERSDDKPPEASTASSLEAQTMAEDAVALLLKHTRGYHTSDSEQMLESSDVLGREQSRNDNKKPKKVLGPQKPSFLDSNSDYETWMPPEGQSGDGRTSLNDRYGY